MPGTYWTRRRSSSLKRMSQAVSWCLSLKSTRWRRKYAVTRLRDSEDSMKYANAPTLDMSGGPGAAAGGLGCAARSEDAS